MSEIAQTGSPVLLGSQQTDGHPAHRHEQDRGGNPARSLTDQSGKPQRRQLLFKLAVASGAPSIACVPKTQLEIQARAKEQMDGSCFAVCLHLPNELSSPSRSGFQVLLKAEGVGEPAAASPPHRRDGTALGEDGWRCVGSLEGLDAEEGGERI